jgi:enamine deaminase RidA (YjgF/YER057c/UK114 family)
MLHAGLGLFLADWLLGTGTPTLVVDSPPSLFRAVIERFMNLAVDNAARGYLGPVIESLGLVSRELYPALVGSVARSLREVAPDLSGYYWHGVGRALYFSRRYFVPALGTAWSSIDNDVQNTEDQNNTMAGLAWAVTLVNMRQPEIIENILWNNIRVSPLQDAFSNGVASAVLVRQETTPEAQFIAELCNHHPRESRVRELWNRLVSSPCKLALYQYYPQLQAHHALGEVFRYRDREELSAPSDGQPTAQKDFIVTERKTVNPWTWQDKLGFSQGIEIQGSRRIVYCAGQTSVDGSGNPVYPRDMAKQINQALDNLEAILKHAGFTLANVVRLNYYTTDITALFEAAPAYYPRLAAAGCKPAATALGVSSLFSPELMIEIEATAVK